MTLKTADQMRQELSERLMSAQAHLVQHMNTTTALKELGAQVGHHNDLHFSGITEQVTYSYFKAVCDELTRIHSDGTPATVELPYDLTHFDTRWHEDEDDEPTDRLTRAMRMRLVDADSADATTQKAMLENVIRRIDFEHIERLLNNQVATLADAGKRMMCESLVSFLNMNTCRNFYEPHRKGRHVVFTHGSMGGLYSYRDVEQLHKIMTPLVRIGEQTGLDVVTPARHLALNIQHLPYDGHLPSRTCFGKGGPLEIVCFKEKYEWRFTLKAVDAIIAYVSLYGGPGAQAAVAKIASLAETGQYKAA